MVICINAGSWKKCMMHSFVAWDGICLTLELSWAAFTCHVICIPHVSRFILLYHSRTLIPGLAYKYVNLWSITPPTSPFRFIHNFSIQMHLRLLHSEHSLSIPFRFFSNYSLLTHACRKEGFLSMFYSPTCCMFSVMGQVKRTDGVSIIHRCSSSQV